MSEEKNRTEEYVRSLNHNYYRVQLEKLPEEKKYQYCILSRGGIRYLLPCEIRYLNGTAFLFYEITSLQNLSQGFTAEKLTRAWFGGFLEGMKKLSGELYRFLLEEECIHWAPQHIFQDYEKKEFFFLFLPYESHYDSFRELLDFFLEKLDYEDEPFVELFYNIYDRFQKIGRDYLTEQIFTDFEQLEAEQPERMLTQEQPADRQEPEKMLQEELFRPQKSSLSVENRDRGKKGSGDEGQKSAEAGSTKSENKSWLSFLSTKKGKEEKPSYRQKMKELMEQYEEESYMVAENTRYLPDAGAENGRYFPDAGAKNSRSFSDAGAKNGDKAGVTVLQEVPETVNEEEDYGKTVYIDNVFEDTPRALYRENGELLARPDTYPFVIGKKKEMVNLALNDPGISRVHAKILKEKDAYFLEDCNSMNGTYKNGVKLEPYERRRLEKEDEIRFGTIKCIFR